MRFVLWRSRDGEIAPNAQLRRVIQDGSNTSTTWLMLPGARAKIRAQRDVGARPTLATYVCVFAVVVRQNIGIQYEKLVDRNGGWLFVVFMCILFCCCCRL